MEILHMTSGVSDLSVASVERYLLSHDWVRGTTTNPRAILYEGPLRDVNGEPLTVILPASKELPDADRRLNDVVRTIAAIESRSPESLVQTIAKPRARRRGVTGKARYKVVARPNPRMLAKPEA